MAPAKRKYKFYDATWASVGLSMIADIITDLEQRQSTITTNGGEEPFENDVFVMRTYCWCDGDLHTDGCPPNFVHKPSGLTIRWYKYNGRGMTCDRAELPAVDWFQIISDCINSVINQAIAARRATP